MFSTLLLIILALSHAGPAEPAAPWKPAVGPLMTRWARAVSVTNPHPEYPRPQMVRKEWLSLNGIWEFAVASANEAVPSGRELPERIRVPFPVESALSGVMKRAERVWYRRTFTLPKGWAGKRVLLHFGAVDWEATVTLNGRPLGTHRGGYDAFSFDLTPALRPSGPQELVVGVWDPTDRGSQPRGKQVNDPKGIYYTPTSGIWQSVWLEPVSETHLAGLTLTPDLDARCLRVKPEVAGAGEAGDLTIEATALAGDAAVGRARGRAGTELVLPVPSPRLWSPAQPFLYDLKVTLRRGERSLDAVTSYFGMRKVELGSDGKVARLLLNGKFLFQVGVLDQGFWPDGLYTAPTDAALRSDIEMVKQLGFNMIRKHVKVEPERWYYWADRLGILVWQDMPSGDNKTPESRRQFETELQRMIEGRRNHPAIIMWVVFNEGWGQYDTERLTRWTQAFDATRLVNNASGWTDMKVGDVIDAHRYPGPGSPPPEPQRAAVLGEFGGLGLPVEGHMWSGTHWGYQGMTTPQQLADRYTALLRRVWSLKEDPGMCAAVYTQVTDVETESNGLLTYDRAVVKADPATLAAANRGDLPPVTAIVPTAEQEANRWRFTFERPAGEWFRPGFEDSGWKEGPAGFGTRGTPGAVVRTVWNTPEIWLRREFSLPDLKSARLLLSVHHDEDVEIYLNGVLAARATGYTTGYEELPLTAEGRAALRPGRNLLAVHCRQTGGGQYVDVGILRVGRD
jgi:hypothetical protein